MEQPEEDPVELEPTAEFESGAVLLPTQEEAAKTETHPRVVVPIQPEESVTDAVLAEGLISAVPSASPVPKRSLSPDTPSTETTPQKFRRLGRKTQVPAHLLPEARSPQREASGVLNVQDKKARRLRCKTQDAAAPKPSAQKEVCSDFLQAVKAILPTLVLAEEFLSPFLWKKLTHRQQYLFVYEKTRSFYVQKVHEVIFGARQSTWKNMSGAERQKQGRKSWAGLAQESKAQLCHIWATAAKAPQHVLAFVESQVNPQKGCITKITAKATLLTWILPLEMVRVTSESLPKGVTVDTLTTHLQSLPPVRELWERLEEHGGECQRAAGADDVAICLEVCPETWTKLGALRLHAHCFLKNNQENLRLRDLRPVFFDGVRPHVSTTVGGMATQGSRSQSWSGFFYCCVPHKTGQLWHATTRVPFTQFLVNPSWIMNLLQAGKMDIPRARDLLVQCRNASRWLRELDITDAEEEKRAVREAMARAEALLNPALSKFKRYSVVDEFQKQFDEPKHRYKFLVLAGPSRLGKTVFARSLVPAGLEVLEVNCAAGKEPDVRAYRLKRHGLILFDEIEANQVVAQRKMFQACAAPVQLGCSATNCHSYEVFLWQKRLVLASNNWHTSVEALASDDREWIHANAMILDVDAPMWSQE